MTRRVLAAVVAVLLAASLALADWLQPDPTYRDAQFLLREALRDTLGHAMEPARLDTLGLALLRLGRFDEARAVYARAQAVDPRDASAAAAFGKLALFADHAEEAESLLSAVVAAGDDPGALADLYAAHLRRGDYARAAELAPRVNDQGRVPLLEALGEHSPYRVTAGPDEVKVSWIMGSQIPLLPVKLNGQSVLMAIDTGASDLILDRSFARRCGVKMLALERTTFWDGSRILAQNALVQKLELGDLRIEDLPAGTAGLRRWMLQTNMQYQQVAGVIGLGLLRRFTPTLDYKKQALELRKPGIPYPVSPEARRVPFEIWGESELTVYGSLNGGRRMALVVATGLAGAGVGAPRGVLEEIGVKPGPIARAMRSAGGVLQGRPWAQVSVPNVVVGPLSVEKVAGWAGALDESELWRHGVRRDALLAHEFFRGRRLTIDWERRELVVEDKQ